jgi:hypothetical protein
MTFRCPSGMCRDKWDSEFRSFIGHHISKFGRGLSSKALRLKRIKDGVPQVQNLTLERTDENSIRT